MTLQLSSRRAAENFARVLEGTADPEVTARYAELARTVARLRATPVPDPRPEFVTALRERLMSAAETELLPVATPRPAIVRHRERRIAAVAAAFVLVGTTAGVATAAERALPGSTFYPIKRGIESAQISMTTNQTAKGREYLAQARTRLDEVAELLDGSDATTEQIASTLDAFGERATQGSDLLFRAYQRDANADDIGVVRQFATTSMAALDRMVELAPPTSTSDFSQAAAILAEIDRQARTLCDDCSGIGALSAPASLMTPADSAFVRLITGPATQTASALDAEAKAKLAAGAKAAQQAAQKAAGATSATASGESGTAGTDQTRPPQVSQSTTVKQPLKTILDTVTTGVLPDPVRKATDPLTETLDPVTGLLDQTLTGLDDTLDNSLGGLTGKSR